MKLLSILFVLLFIFGCSGKVQTNPVPDNTAVHIPTNFEMSLKEGVSNEVVRDYEFFVKKIFEQSQTEENQIWSLGLRRDFK